MNLAYLKLLCIGVYVHLCVGMSSFVEVRAWLGMEECGCFASRVLSIVDKQLWHYDYGNGNEGRERDRNKNKESSVCKAIMISRD